MVTTMKSTIKNHEGLPLIFLEVLAAPRCETFAPSGRETQGDSPNLQVLLEAILVWGFNHENHH
jgi:hypothetical protein